MKKIPSTNFWTRWQTITLGTGLKTADDFRQALEENGCHVSDEASRILEHPMFSVSDTKTEMDLYILTIDELAFGSYIIPRLWSAYWEAKQRNGFQLCPPEVAPQLLLQCPEVIHCSSGDPMTDYWETIHIAMEQITLEYEFNRVITARSDEIFSLRYDYRRKTRALSSYGGGLLGKHRRLVFTKLRT